MLGEREVITVAFGNYSSLVAAQWANGTSKYDQHHHTLYRECRAADVLGGNGGDSGDSSFHQRARVPRLLLLDAPYSSTFDDVETWEDKYSPDNTDEQEEEEGARCHNDVRHIDTTSADSVLWGGSGSAAGGRWSSQKVDKEQQRLDGTVTAVQRQMWSRHGFDEEEEDSDATRAEESDDETDDDDYTRLRRELGIAPYGASDSQTNTRSDNKSLKADEEDTTHNSMPRHKQLTQRQQAAKLKKRLFDTHNTTIPWWQYITTGLGAHSVTSVKPLQHIDTAGDIPALHSFGYGMAQLHANKNNELAAFSDALRMQLESADQLQGVQCFTDGDGMFGGAAANTLEQFCEDVGSKTPVVNTCFFTPLPSFITDRKNSSEVAFRERRLDEAALNQLLATLQLSRQTSAVYIPMPLAQWSEFFRRASTADSPAGSPAWLKDERATAQYAAAIVDTALYGLRDSGNTNCPHSKRERESTHGAKDDTALHAQGAMYYMDDWCRVVRPAPSLRVAAAMGALPQPVAQSNEFWAFLEANPLLPEAPVIDERLSSKEVRAHDPASLKTGFIPLTHSMSTYSPLSSSGQVLGHAVSMRGAAVLPSTVYPTREALLRYALPLGTSTYLPLVTESNYPLSSTFPMELMFADPAAVERQLPRGFSSLRDTLKSVDVGAHVLSTYASAPMIREVVSKAQASLRYKMDQYCAAYEMEKDEWQEMLNEGLTVYDDYHHAALSDADNSDGGEDDY
ncbi:hypothetical protein ABL78_2092 [Leptomonas seymouri]|uniref:Uncharacterized protein n=1 Tax=Leptomonas seymouri TaxID=5684 RepID=A0A0N0P7U7_LEPSE|nr:hypothetical protein ABL78_2092 [Leptomonas seymouri]|eukprot:KPI88777.1 hypothetical protein ABL78_2092 [Leptomonas seymouri]